MRLLRFVLACVAGIGTAGAQSETGQPLFPLPTLVSGAAFDGLPASLARGFPCLGDTAACFIGNDFGYDDKSDLAGVKRAVFLRSTYPPSHLKFVDEDACGAQLLKSGAPAGVNVQPQQTMRH